MLFDPSVTDDIRLVQIGIGVLEMRVVWGVIDAIHLALPKPCISLEEA